MLIITLAKEGKKKVTKKEIKDFRKQIDLSLLNPEYPVIVRNMWARVEVIPDDLIGGKCECKCDCEDK